MVNNNNNNKNNNNDNHKDKGAKAGDPPRNVEPRERREDISGLQGKGAGEKLITAIKETPFVPLVAAVTGMTLMYTSYELRRYMRTQHPPPPPPPPPPFYVTFRPVIIKGAVCGLLLTGIASGIYINNYLEKKRERDRRRL